MAHSYPPPGWRQNGDGVFAGMLSSRVTARGRPAGARVLVSVLFLSAQEATGTVCVLGATNVLGPEHSGNCSSHETLTLRAMLTE